MPELNNSVHGSRGVADEHIDSVGISLLFFYPNKISIGQHSPTRQRRESPARPFPCPQSAGAPPAFLSLRGIGEVEQSSALASRQVTSAVSAETYDSEEVFCKNRCTESQFPIHILLWQLVL